MRDDKSKKLFVTDNRGHFIFYVLPNDTIVLTASTLGYRNKTTVFISRMNDTLSGIRITLVPFSSPLNEVTVQTTRTGSRLRASTTRIEAIAPDELDEKSTMKPGDIRMLLNESTGITTQTTSAVSGLASLRIQGLDGRYTQILKDGMPLYTGFSGSLGILQIAPLDLKQVEYIKGSASTLYGGGAIAGLVNLITKTPSEKHDHAVYRDA